MARSRKPVNPLAENALDQLKFEVANELGITERVRQQGWSTMASADCGRVGGHMVRHMIRSYEDQIAGKTQTTTGNTLGGTMTAQYDPNDPSQSGQAVGGQAGGTQAGSQAGGGRVGGLR